MCKYLQAIHWFFCTWGATQHSLMDTSTTFHVFSVQTVMSPKPSTEYKPRPWETIFKIHPVNGCTSSISYWLRAAPGWWVSVLWHFWPAVCTSTGDRVDAGCQRTPFDKEMGCWDPEAEPVCTQWWGLGMWEQGIAGICTISLDQDQYM